MKEGVGYAMNADETPKARGDPKAWGEKLTPLKAF